ncbi:glutathione S-transferase family protein [Rhodobacteraceae bacterium]|nr:glutathione S-transferase family protein [Paracoccaceae bacterium]
MIANLTLFSMPSSGNSYKARLLLALLGRDYAHVGMEYETPELADAHANGTLPFGKLPVLQLADGTQIPESNAILCYLAEDTDWLPQDPILRAHVLGWMFWEQNQHEGVIAVRAALLTYPSRAHLATPERLAELLEAGHGLLGRMDDNLSGQYWIAGDTPTVADIALYAYTHTAGSKGGYDLGRFPAVCEWIDRIVALPGYVDLNDTPR